MQLSNKGSIYLGVRELVISAKEISREGMGEDHALTGN